jgi:hypothetical protein
VTAGPPKRIQQIAKIPERQTSGQAGRDEKHSRRILIQGVLVIVYQSASSSSPTCPA